jgi:hypothetical protein
VDNIETHFRGTELDGKDYIHMAQDGGWWRALFEHGNEPSGAIKSWEVLE